MSYLVLARKYRPANFEQLVGQPHVVQALSHALSSQRLHHAYLFTGTRGVGKTTISRILAKSLNCVGSDGQGTITATPCGVCEACTAIDQGRFVDYTELDAASNRGVDEVQSLLEQAVYKPVQGRFKVFMIDEVHMLTGHAFNAMLKTLEEPPAYLKFVLATTDPQKVPVTVLSRCLQFNLRPMPPATVQSHLQTILTQEGVTFEPPALSLLARSARGSMRDALSLTDQAIAFGAGTVRECDVRQMLGSVDEGHVIALLQAVIHHDASAVLQVCNDLQTQGSSARLTLQSICQSLQRMAVMQALQAQAGRGGTGKVESATSASPWMAEDFDGQAEALAPLAELLSMQQTQLLYSMCLHGMQELGLAPDEYTALAMVMLRFLSFKPDAAGQGAQAVAKALPAAAAMAPVAAMAEKKTEPAPQSPQPLADAAQSQSAQAIPSPTAANATVGDGKADGQPAVTLSASPSTTPSINASISPAEVAAPVALHVSDAPPSTATSALPMDALAAQGASDVQGAGDASDAGQGLPWDTTPVNTGFAASESISNNHPSAQRVNPPASTAAPAALPSGGGLMALAVRETTGSGQRTEQINPRVQVAAAPAQLVITPLGDEWAKLVQQLCDAQSVTGLVRELALQSQLLAKDQSVEGHDAANPQRWQLRIERESLGQGASRQRLQDALGNLLGTPVQLSLELGPAQDTPAKRQAAAAAERAQAAEDLIHQDPTVQMLMQEFGATVIQGSIQVVSAP